MELEEAAFDNLLYVSRCNRVTIGQLRRHEDIANESLLGPTKPLKLPLSSPKSAENDMYFA